MSREISTLHLLVPGLLESVCGGSKQLPKGSFPVLEKFLARSEKTPSSMDFPHLTASLLGLPFDIQKDVPTAAISAIGLIDKPELTDSCWIQGYPVMLTPDRDRLVLHPVHLPDDDKQLDNKLQQLAAQLLEHFPDFFKNIFVTREHGWLFQLKHDVALQTTPLIEASGRNIDNLLPVGKDAVKWHSLLNEVQMLFYSLETQEYGFNSLWFEGAGCLPENAYENQSVAVIGDESLVSAAATWCEASQFNSLTDFHSSETAFTTLIMADLTVMHAILNRSEDEWLKSVKQLENLLAEALSLLKQGKVSLIKLYPFDGMQYQMDRKAMFRFWKKARSLTEFCAKAG